MDHTYYGFSLHVTVQVAPKDSEEFSRGAETSFGKGRGGAGTRLLRGQAVTFILRHKPSGDHLRVVFGLQKLRIADCSLIATIDQGILRTIFGQD